MTLVGCGRVDVQRGFYIHKGGRTERARAEKEREVEEPTRKSGIVVAPS